MTYLMTPVSFDGLTLDGSGYISSSDFTVPVQRVLSKITAAAGGYLVDLDYGQPAQTVPQPFSLVVHIKAPTPALLRSAWASLVVKTGVSGYFVCQTHGGGSSYRATAQMAAPQMALGGHMFGPHTTALSGVAITFTPVTSFVVVT